MNVLYYINKKVCFFSKILLIKCKKEKTISTEVLTGNVFYNSIFNRIIECVILIAANLYLPCLIYERFLHMANSGGSF